MRWKRTHLGFSPMDVPVTSHVKFLRGKQPNRNYSAILANLQITSYALGV
jgi:hypothetical protein